MAKIYKVTGYVVDFRDEYDEDYIRLLIEQSSDLFTRHFHVESADVGEWYDEHPLNYYNSDISECEKYFTEECAHWDLYEEYYGDTIVSREWRCSNCGYATLRWSGFIENLRGEPYHKPNYKCCPNCMKKMEG